MLKNFILFLFFIIFIESCSVVQKRDVCFSINENYSYTIFFNGKNYNFKDLDSKPKLANMQNKNYQNLKTLKKLKQLGFSEEEILTYLFPETLEIFLRISKNFNKEEISDKVLVVENKCKLNYIDGEKGKIINRQKFFKDCLNQIEDNKKNIEINLEIIDYKINKTAKELFSEKSCFSTNFSSSSEERKNNIRLALKAFDGLVIDEGEVFSFNEITGKRNIESGYKEAKIISGGTFVLGTGGGVCQVSTTLFNACLLSGLEIVESSTHSLPVSYVEPSFDAMVSYGSADLKIRNNSGGKIIITTSSENDICKIKIFGIKNKYKITRQSEKLSIIPIEKDVIDTDYKKYGNYELEIGEEKRISYAKEGLISRAYLNFYNEKGELVERKKIRENKYNATRGVIIKREK